MEFEERYDFNLQRRRMVDDDLAARDITDPLVLEAFLSVPRHRFLDPARYPEAYADHPVPIGYGQTISQPYIVALMTQLLELKPGMKVLEVGTGSGYQTAILAATGVKVFSIERHEGLTERAATVLASIGMDSNIEFLVGNGSLGVEEESPFDRIIVTAAAAKVPQPLLEQLSPDMGRMVIPVGKENQELMIINRSGDHYEKKPVLPVIFVPLIGA